MKVVAADNAYLLVMSLAIASRSKSDVQTSGYGSSGLIMNLPRENILSMVVPQIYFRGSSDRNTL